MEDEIKFNRLKIRPGVRIEKDSFNNKIVTAPRFVSEYEILDKNFIGFGLNRYYGRNLFNYKIYNDTQKYRILYTRNSADEAFSDAYPSHEINGDNDLKTPYDDEFSVFYRGDIKNARINLKYIKREGKDEVLTLNGAKIGKDETKSYFTNNGKSSSKIYTLAIQNIDPIYIFGTKNDFEISLTHMKRNSNFRDYSDNSDEKEVVYEGRLIRASELPIVDFIVPFGANFNHNIKFSNFNITNLVRYTNKTPVLASSYNRNFKKTEYRKVELPSRTIWDMRIGYEKNLKDDFRFFANLDINNILNKKYTLTATGRSFGAGRNFWLEMGVKW